MSDQSLHNTENFSADRDDLGFPAPTEPGPEYSGTEIAIIGMAGRFPGARNLQEFWENLSKGVESITFFSDEETLATGVNPSLVSDPHYVKAAGILEDEHLFDTGFFGIYPREAAITDPQQRIFLETAWQALEHAGYNPDAYPGYIGLFAGMGMNTYMMFNLLPNREVFENTQAYQLTISNDKDFLPTRVSYKLNLRGPSVNVQTACSTSLVAVHLACQGLLSYQSDIVLAGGVTIRVPQKQGYLYQEGGILSPDGHCRAFDVDASGTVGGNGVGIVVLKRLEEALQDGDTIHAVIRGSAINNDGSLKVGYTAPSVEGQADVIATAQVLANVSPESISYIEAHGTGTSLGDPIEISALNQVFRANTNQLGFCAIGSVKTNIGHLDAAAGVASLIKTILALEHKQIPPSINFNEPNPKIDFDNSPFYVNAQLRDWDIDPGVHGTIRRAGVSSFGIGGTNAHVVLEEAPHVGPSDPSRPSQLIILSARSGEALEQATDNLAEYLQGHPDINLADVAYTHQVGRKSFDARRIFVCQGVEDAIQALTSRDPQRMRTVLPQGDQRLVQNPSVVFMFSGQGSQYINMARELYEQEAIFRDTFDQCVEFLIPELGVDLREIIYPDLDKAGTSLINREEQDQTAAALRQTQITQPALFVMEYALSQLLISWGIYPKAMIGHSIGEYVAATLAGVFSLEDALLLVAARGRLMQQLPGGSMISVPLAEADVHNLLESVSHDLPSLSLATINSPTLCVVSGPSDEVDSFISFLEKMDVDFRRLHTSHAFHSPMMDPIIDEFAELVEQLDLQPPQIPFISNVTGNWIIDEDATDPCYWGMHLRKPVRFSDGILELLKDPTWIFLEVGPGNTLTTLSKSVLISEAGLDVSPSTERVILSTTPHPKTGLDRTTSDGAGIGLTYLLNTIGEMWLSGVEIDWNAFYAGERRYRIPLPTYPFERQSYWIDPDAPLMQILAGDLHPGSIPARLKGKRSIPKVNDVSKWFYVPSWKRKDILINTNRNRKANRSETGENWLVIDSGSDTRLTTKIIQELYAYGHKVALASLGEPVKSAITKELGAAHIEPELFYVSQADQPQGYDALLQSLLASSPIPDNILFLPSISENGSSSQEQFQPFYHFLYLVQALTRHILDEIVYIGLISIGAQDVFGTEQLNPQQATMVGLGKVISQEYPNLIVKGMDIEPIEDNDDEVVWQILSEMNAQVNERFVAFRSGHRWVQEHSNLELSAASLTSPSILRQNGVYLITGGLGRIGMTLAEFLARQYQARLVLVDRFDLPVGATIAEWEDYLDWSASGEASEKDLSTIDKVRLLKSMVEQGADVLIIKADVANLQEMQEVILRTEAKFGNIHGVIHAAGIVGERAILPIAETTIEDCQTQFEAKVYALPVLEEVLKGKDFDFILLQSSLSAVLGGLGFGIYTAANLFMDVYATRQNKKSGKTRWISVNWDGWRFNESQLTAAAIPGSSVQTGMDLAIIPEEGIQAFDLISRIGVINPLIVSTADLNARVEQWIHIPHVEKNPVQSDVELESAVQMPEISRADAQTMEARIGFPRPNLRTEFVAPRNEIESAIANTWRSVLGIDRVGVYDDFFELGGHSLLATQLATRLRDTYKVDLPLRKLFESPTVAGLAELIQNSLEPQMLDQFTSLVQVPWNKYQDKPGQALEQIPAQAVEVAIDKQSAVSQTADPLRIQRVSREGELELSFGQQRLWFLDQLEPESPLYNNSTAIRLSGNLDLAALEYALRQIVSRHEVLRTVFYEHNGQPIQVILDDPIAEEVTTNPQNVHEKDEATQESAVPVGGAITPVVEVVDLSVLDEAERDTQVKLLAVEEARKPFDLAQGPLFRIKVIQLSQVERILLLTMHHIVSDGWSVRVLIGEFAAFYEAYLNRTNFDQDPPSPLPELSIQYVDYAYWQRDWLQGERLERQLDYWKKILGDDAGDSGNVELTPDRPRPAFQTTNGATLWFDLPAELSTKLIELSHAQGVTLFMTLLSALVALLNRYTGQTDINIGTPVANRSQLETESLIGFVLNTLVMRTDISGDPSFMELLKRVREVALGAYAHQDVPFEMLVESLQPQRDMSRSPFFQIIFDLQESPLPALELSGLKISPYKFDTGTAKFDLALSMEMSDAHKTPDALERRTQLAGFFNYNTDLFDRETIERLLEHWKLLLEGIVAHPDQRISELSLMSEQELEQVVHGWNATETGEGPAAYIYEQIERQVRKYPDKIAAEMALPTAGLEGGDLSVSYAALNRRANQLARHLMSRGVKQGDLVGLLLGRSLEMVVAILGVLKAGAGFVPMDTVNPQERLKYILEDTRSGDNRGIRVMVTQTGPAFVSAELRNAILSEDNGLDFVYLDQDWEHIAEHDESDPSVQVRDDDLAYVIYTSGSTGLPKGVEITHRAIADHIRGVIQHFGIQTDDRVLQFASYTFDQGLEQVLATLAGGGTLVVRGEEVWPAENFREVVELNELSVINLPPAYWNQVIEELSEEDDAHLPGVRLVIVGGDVLTKESLERWQKSGIRDARLLNAYGPTETTITATTYEVGKDYLQQNEVSVVPIGKPLANRKAYVLDRGGNPVPIGVPGELHLGGIGLARGYLNRQELTAEKFVPDRFSGRTVDRLYRTGDLVRYRVDGNLEFIGRVDQQVKIRGFRVELGEIEAVLMEHVAVQEAVVTAHEEMPGQKRLVAYVVGRDSQALSIGEMRSYLEQRLPGYMVPAVFVMLEQMPLTSSGKVDRRALPKPESVRPEGLEVAYVAPRSDLEEEIAQFWREVLGVEKVGVHDNFFELGGHSLLATQLISRLREAYHVDLPVKRLFETPTVAGLATTIAMALIEEETEEDLQELLNELDGLSQEDIQAILSDEGDNE